MSFRFATTLPRLTPAAGAARRAHTEPVRIPIRHVERIQITIGRQKHVILRQVCHRGKARLDRHERLPVDQFTVPRNPRTSSREIHAVQPSMRSIGTRTAALPRAADDCEVTANDHRPVEAAAYRQPHRWSRRRLPPPRRWRPLRPQTRALSPTIRKRQSHRRREKVRHPLSSSVRRPPWRSRC